MRLDKFLKITRVIKRRTISNDVCDNGLVLVNGVSKKPSYDVKVGDVIKLSYFNNDITIKVKEIPTRQIKNDEINNYIEVE